MPTKLSNTMAGIINTANNAKEVNFSNEKQGQENFYLVYIPLVDPTLTKDQILNDYTDGVVNGNI